MVKKILLPALAGVTMAIAPVSLVGATGDNHREHEGFTLRGAGTCQADGSFKIIWTVKDRDEDNMKIVFSSNENVVPDNTKIKSHESMDFTQTVSGSTAANYSLVLKARFIDKEEHEKEVQWKKDTVKLTTPCPQPAPVSGGQGGGAVLGAQVTAAPSGGVSAGNGGGVAASLGVTAAGLTGSLAAAGLGLRRLSRN